MLSQSELANAIRFLSVDAIQKANSGHPGMPLGMADIATILWREFLHHNPNNPNWINRDRFIISNGHGSMLLYSLLHLTGYDLSINDLKNFRQLHSKTPGHPEFGLTPGVETTTGPLGQGLANAVGMALAEKILATQFNRPKFNLIDHYTYVFVGDGCLMEGISHEAASFAGTHGLGTLIVFWDNNGISIDGETCDWFTDDIVKRFQAYNWHVIPNIDGYNPDVIRKAIQESQKNSDKPSIICCKTVIGFGSPHMCNSCTCHGSPLGAEEVLAMRNYLGWQYEPFVIPKEIYSAWDIRKKGQEEEDRWQELYNAYGIKYPELAQEFLRRKNGKLPQDFVSRAQDYIKETITGVESLATRQASQKALNFYGTLLPELLGGSADLTASNLTNWSGSKTIAKDDASGNYLHYGVREFGMFAIMNGVSLYGGFVPYGGTFLVFASYGHSAIRMAAMMKRQVIYVFSHDSIGLGEDGPTHQPVEQLAMLRATPNLSVWRPCNMVETAIAWQYALEHKDGPTALIFTRQKLATESHYDLRNLADIKRGGYILIDVADGMPDWILIATGSEVALACKVALKLKEDQGGKIRVVSMPSQDVFDSQDDIYKERVLPKDITKRVAIEAASSQSWYKYVGMDGKVIGLDRYGESAPDKILFEFFGFSEHNITKLILSQ
ncbi:MAG: transketolase [Coxiellaceae bacterium]|jgi:transketolase|nr:transketolase [Coxiellaceae bacterium]